MRLELETRRFYLGRDYSDAVEASGGIPIHIPLIPDETYIRTVMEGLDGVLLPGCDSDLDPALYGEQPHVRLGRVVPEKDRTDLLVLGEVERRNLPLLAICYGIQALNVSRGGTLIQDIESQVENCVKHDQGIPRDRNSHDISLEPASLLEKLSGRADGGEVRVNSHHHQAIRRTGRDLRATARANDGVIEGIEDIRPDRFVLGVQWHPELSWNSDELSRAIFDEFVSRCAKDGDARDVPEAAHSLETLAPV